MAGSKSLVLVKKEFRDPLSWLNISKSVKSIEGGCVVGELRFAGTREESANPDLTVKV